MQAGRLDRFFEPDRSVSKVRFGNRDAGSCLVRFRDVIKTIVGLLDAVDAFVLVLIVLVLMATLGYAAIGYLATWIP